MCKPSAAYEKILVLIREKEETLGMARGGTFRAAAKLG